MATLAKNGSVVARWGKTSPSYAGGGSKYLSDVMSRIWLHIEQPAFAFPRPDLVVTGNYRSYLPFSRPFASILDMDDGGFARSNTLGALAKFSDCYSSLSVRGTPPVPVSAGCGHNHHAPQKAMCCSGRHTMLRSRQYPTGFGGISVFCFRMHGMLTCIQRIRRSV